MKYFCFYFPVRLGVIITSILAIVQDIASLIYLMFQESDFLKTYTKEFLMNDDELTAMTWMKRALNFVDACNDNNTKIIILESKINFKSSLIDPEQIKLVIIGLFFLHIITCLQNILAALKMWRAMVFVFILSLGDFINT